MEENVNVPVISPQCLSTDDITTSHDFGKQDPRGARKAWSGGEYGVAR